MKIFIPDPIHPAGVEHVSKHAEIVRWDDVRVKNWPEEADGVVVRGYTAWERLRADQSGEPRFAPALETLSIDLAMARDPVDADVAHAHTWYADMAGLWIRTLHRIPLVVTLHSMEPLRPWKADQLGSGYLLSSWIEKTAVEAADRVIAVSRMTPLAPGSRMVTVRGNRK